VDGNALGGLFFEVFGRDMTAQLGCCGECGAVNPLGQVLVYRDAPGHVIRCPACSRVLMVIVEHAARFRVTFEHLRWIEPTRA
jgi:4-hydroxy-3-methylbut-2-en-1-yl diphosphate synthase IspG/GcpE